MTSKGHQLAAARLRHHARTTSLRPLHPGNAPGPWETAALVLHATQLARELASADLQVAELLTLGEDETT